MPELTESDKKQQVDRLVLARCALLDAQDILCQTIINLDQIRQLRDYLILATSMVTSVEHRLTGWPDPNKSVKKEA